MVQGTNKEDLLRYFGERLQEAARGPYEQFDNPGGFRSANGKDTFISWADMEEELKTRYQELSQQFSAEDIKAAIPKGSDGEHIFKRIFEVTEDEKREKARLKEELLQGYRKK